MHSTFHVIGPCRRCEFESTTACRFVSFRVHIVSQESHSVPFWHMKFIFVSEKGNLKTVENVSKVPETQVDDEHCLQQGGGVAILGGTRPPSWRRMRGCVHGGCVLVTVSTGACRRPQVVIWLWLQRHDCSRGHASIKQARTLQQVLTYENYSLISPGLVFKAYREITSSMVVISKNLSKEIHPTLMMQCATLARSPNNDKPSKLLE